MLQCPVRRTYLGTLQQHRRRATLRWTAATKPLILRKAYSTDIESPAVRTHSNDWGLHQAANRLPFPNGNERRDPAEWIALLENGLPSHLRHPGKSQSGGSFDAEDIAEVLLAAQGLPSPKNGLDLLSYLGIQQGRWSAVVWLVKHLVESFGSPHARSERLSQTLCSWSHQEPLEELTRDSIDMRELLKTDREPCSSFPLLQTFDELTSDLRPEDLSRNKRLQRDALGQIWRSLGNMTISCADGEIKPQILEIIAYLHHTEIMPNSIYNRKPSADATAVQQTPIINLVSSRILTSLSDAAWRAHEKLIVEEATSKGSKYASLKPEIPGTAYRVNVAGLRPEIWMELILWSCLHGGWIVEGADILHMIYSEPSSRQWKPISWRSLVSCDTNDELDWDKITYISNTRAPSTMDHDPPSSDTSIERTISSEVINAYVDALLSVVHVGVGARGESPGYVIKRLNTLQELLSRSGLALGSGSWDAVVLRLFDAQESIAHHRNNFGNLVHLSPVMGREVESSNVRTVPEYVFDGSAAVLGLFHHVLRLRIRSADVKGSLEVFQALQTRADENKRRSVADFVRTQQSLARLGSTSENGLFTSSFSGIDYPAFDVQIPPTIIGPFMELIMDAKAYDFGKWLLYSEEVDGPVIPPQKYANDAITPALIRFATETNDESLLSELVRARSVSARPGEQALSGRVLQSFFESQVNLCRWDEAIQILQYMKKMKKTKYAFWHTVNLAHVARVMLLQVRDANAGDETAKENLAHAKGIFVNMIRGEYEREGERKVYVDKRISILLAILAVVDQAWAKFCLQLFPLEGHHQFQVSVKIFDLILDGVVEAYGSVAGRRLLGIFWSHQVREAQSKGQRVLSKSRDTAAMARFRTTILDNVERQRTVLRLPGHAENKVIIYGGLRPSLTTIRIIFRMALIEFKEGRHVESEEWKEVSQFTPPGADTLDTPSSDDEEVIGEVDLSASGMILWSVRRLRDLGMTDGDIRDELAKSLSEFQLQDLEAELPYLFEQANAEEDSS